jgi:hypothetical protein
MIYIQSIAENCEILFPDINSARAMVGHRFDGRLMAAAISTLREGELGLGRYQTRGSLLRL